MSTLLQINASILGEQGQSSQLGARFVAAWKERNPSGQVVKRVYAEGLAIGADTRESSLSGARAQIDHLFAQPIAA